MNSPASENWYAEGLSFQCTQCGNCCSGPSQGYVWVTDEDIACMASIMDLQNDLETFRRRFVRQVGTKQSLVEYSDGDCIFLDPHSRGCLVYDARPSQCRTWPFWQSNLQTRESWDKTARECPGCNRGRVYSLEEIHGISKSSNGLNA